MARQDDSTTGRGTRGMHYSDAPRGEDALLRKARETVNRIRRHSVTRRIRESRNPKE